MQRLTFGILLFAAVTACGDDGGETTGTGTEQTTGGATTGTDPTTSTSGDTTIAPTTGTSGTTGEPATTQAVDTTGDATTAEVTTAEATTAEVTTAGETTGDTTGETTGDTTGDTTTGESSPLVIAIVDAELWADCMPIVEPDPVQGSWYVEFDNTANPAATMAVVTSASLSLPGMPEEILVDPAESPLLGAGEYVSQEVHKLAGAMHSACDHCNEFYLLELEYDENGVKHHVQEDVTISCAF